MVEIIREIEVSSTNLVDLCEASDDLVETGWGDWSSWDTCNMNSCYGSWPECVESHRKLCSWWWLVDAVIEGHGWRNSSRYR